MIAKIRLTPLYAYVSTPYDADFVANLKWSLPSRARRWDPELKVWRVERRYLYVLEGLLREYFDSVLYDIDEEPTTRQEAPQAPYAALHLLPSAPTELIDAAYKALAQIYHPDRNPRADATRIMQVINDAYEQLKARKDYG